MPSDCLKIIKSKSKVRQSRAKAVVATVNSNSSTPAISSDVAELKDMQNCPATSGNVYQDNINEYVSQAAAANYNQENTDFRPQIVANQIKPLGFPPVQNNPNNFNRGNNFTQNRGGNFNQFAFNQSQLHRPQVNQAPAYQAPILQTQNVSQTDFKRYVKANDAVLRNIQSQGQSTQTQCQNIQNQYQTVQNQLANLTDMMSKFLSSNMASSSGSGTLPGFASLSRPLTQLLKKNAFKLSLEAKDSFEELKRAMIEASVLGLPDFNEPFIIETDASEVGLGVVLQQKGHPIAYLNHFSLKYLLDQRITTPTHMKWLPKLMEYDYEMVYKKGSDNGAADALSRLENARQPAKKHYCWVNDTLLRNGKIVVGQDSNLKTKLLQYFHESTIGGHSRVKVFLDSIYKLHGLPESIISDRDKVFISAFWKELFKVLKVKLLMSTAYHPQTYGQINVVNRCLEGHLRCMTGLSKVDAVDRSLLDRENVIKMLKFHLQRSQNIMKQQADKSRTERQFEVGDMGFLKMQPHKQVTIRQDKQYKFS
uniref:Retrotransposon protein, putative, unclassified n=1 Tax=Tanacetum cinerariifolium TaxID=118510 RepID=A0A6L2NQ53_TANCI|nr:retrotransposon protein, putative, unclassified [Tanacetum cinerariifolium]